MDYGHCRGDGTGSRHHTGVGSRAGRIDSRDRAARLLVSITRQRDGGVRSSMDVDGERAAYQPLWVALGQIGLYLCILVTFTFYIRRQLGNHLWHVIHFASYGMFAFALLHGL